LICFFRECVRNYGVINSYNKEGGNDKKKSFFDEPFHGLSFL